MSEIATFFGSQGQVVTLPVPGTAHVKTAWVDLVPGGFGRDLHGIHVFVQAPGTSRYLIDIGVGGAGSEQILIPNIMVASASVRELVTLQLPLRILRSTRIAGRHQADQTAFAPSVVVNAWGGIGLGDPGPVTVYGAVPASTQGTTVTPSATAGQFGAWAELTPSTTRPFRHLTLLMSLPTTPGSDRRYWVYLGIGASGSEQTILTGVPFFAYNVNNAAQPARITIPMALPSGVRLASRCYSDQASSPSIEVSVLGVG